MSESALGQ